MPGQWPTVQCDTVPGDALHVRHPGIVIEARVVVLILLDDGENTRRRLAACGAGRHWRAQDPALGVVESDLLAADRYDRHDRLACLARRHGLGGWRGARLFSLQTRGDRTGLYARDDRSSRHARADRIALRARGDRTGLYSRDDRISRYARANRIALRARGDPTGLYSRGDRISLYARDDRIGLNLWHNCRMANLPHPALAYLHFRPTAVHL